MSSSSPPSINIARFLYLALCEGAGVAIALGTKGQAIEVPLWVGVTCGLVIAGVFILIDTLIKNFTLRGFSTATFGLCVGLFCAWLLARVEISKLLTLPFHDIDDSLIDAVRMMCDVMLFASFGFLGVVLALRSSRDEFAFIIPYVRFRQDGATGQPVVIDPEVVMDGRVMHILQSGFLNGRIIVPRFVLQELQVMAHSPAPATRQRGQRGLDNLELMQQAPDIQVVIHDTSNSSEHETLDSRLLETSRLLGARLMTLDDNLTKVGKLRGADVLNINELIDALKPAVAVGERLRIALVRGGKEEHQGVGYLADGSMIVVNHAVSKIGTTVDAIVISTLQTTGGMMVFAELANPDA